MSWSRSILSLVVVALLVGINAFFVAAEFSIVRVRRTRLEELVGQGVDSARITLLLVDRLSDSLATTQMGVTIASLGVGWLGEGSFAHLLNLLFPSIFSSAAGPHVLASVLAFGVIMVMHVVLGEMVPKNMALDRAEAISLRIARPLNLCGQVLRPLVWAFTGIARFCTKLLGHRGHEAQRLSEQELKLVLKESHDGGVITASEAQIIHQALEFADKTAADLLIPTEDVVYLSLSRSTAENAAVATRTQHTRLPLCQDGLDSAIGIVNMKDAWPLLMQARTSEVLKEVSRPVPWIDATTSQDQVLRQLQQHRAHMGCVRSGPGGHVLGVITIEEVLESLLGDLREGKVPHVRNKPPVQGRKQRKGVT